jgi:hypothetical protein
MFKLIKRTVMPAVLCIIAANAYCCDICGCGGGNYYMGLMPHFKKSFFGIRYSYMKYHTVMSDDPTQFSTNYYNTTELWGGTNIGKKWQVIGFVPYHFNKQVDDDGTTTPHGLGDIKILINYKLFSSSKLNKQDKTVEQTLWIGGGIKLPTSSFNVDVDASTTLADVNAQIGTGSTDFFLNAMYNIGIGNFGVSTAANYKIGTANKSHYKYGNKVTASSLAYYRFKAGRGKSIAPNAGFIYENATYNTLSGEKIDLTGNHLLSGSFGIEYNISKISIGINAQAPLTQNYADGQTKMQLRGMAHVTLAF